MTIVRYFVITALDTDARAAGCGNIRSGKASGASRDGRTEQQLLLDFLRKGDTLSVTRVDHLVRRIKYLQDIVYFEIFSSVLSQLNKMLSK